VLPAGQLEVHGMSKAMDGRLEGGAEAWTRAANQHFAQRGSHALRAKAADRRHKGSVPDKGKGRRCGAGLSRDRDAATT
jgi:hypothetical protein